MTELDTTCGILHKLLSFNQEKVTFENMYCAFLGNPPFNEQINTFWQVV